MTDILRDETTYKALDQDPTEMVKNKIRNLLKKWKRKKHYDCKVQTKDTILAKS